MINKNQKTEYYNGKRKNLLFLLGASLFMVSAVMITLVLFEANINTITLVLFILMIGLLILIFWMKPKLMYYAMQYRYHLLLANSESPYAMNAKFDSRWINRLTNDKFTFAFKDDQVDILYRISKPIEQSAFHSNHLLEMIAIIKDNEMDLYSDMLNEQYKIIWQQYQAKYRISKQVILQFKKYDSYNESIKEELDQIIAFREGINYFVTINCGYFEKEGTVYYLHADGYYPNIYYKYATGQMEKIVEKQSVSQVINE